MKISSFFLAAAACGISVYACHNSSNTDSKATADSLNSMKDSVVDSTRSITSSLHMTVSKGDASFAVEAAAGGLEEVELGRMAEKKGSDQTVRDFGAMMVRDHSHANAKLKEKAKGKGISLPDSLDTDGLKLRASLEGKRGKDFDKAYADAMVKDHQQDVKAFESAIPRLRDTSLKNFATSTLPVLKMHLSSAESMKKALH